MAAAAASGTLVGRASWHWHSNCCCSPVSCLPAHVASCLQCVYATSEPLLRGRDAVALPLDYYKLLGVSGVCSRDSLARALEK